MKEWRLVLSVTLVTYAPGTLPAAILTGVPMQGGMVMPMPSYSQAADALSVVMDPTVPQLTPLLVSNPLDGFDPADPWYDGLDPSRQGLAFSRRYGFVMDTMTDPVPANRAIWIHKLEPVEQGIPLSRRQTQPAVELWIERVLRTRSGR